jgi:LPS export ABC transporter permease LptG
VLVGVLIGLWRMSGDSEVVALHAAGIGPRRLLVPVGILAVATGVFTLAMTAWWGPVAMRTLRSLEEQLRTAQASSEVQPRVFDERFARYVVYLRDVEAAGTRWHGIFLAESGTGTISRLTLTQSAILAPYRAEGKLQFHLQDGAIHEYDRAEPGGYSVSTFKESDLPVAVAEARDHRSSQPFNAERSLRELLVVQGEGWPEARVELHRRLAFPTACLVFALLGVPLGVRPRLGRGGRASGFVLALLLICGYYLLFVTGAGMARRGALGPAFGIWAANLLSGLVGFVLLPRMEQVRAEGILTRWAEIISDWRRSDGRRHAKVAAGPAAGGHPAPRKTASVVSIAAPKPAPSQALRRAAHAGGFPLLIDLYLLRNFLTYVVATLLAFLLLFESFTFFELLEDIARHNVSFRIVADYFRYLTPQMVYLLLPLAALVALLVTLGLLAKHNEITAFKAGGISLYRLSLPLVVAGMALALGMFLLDDFYLPFANQKQDALRNQIKGRPAQTFYQPRRQWIVGEDWKMYNYELFDSDRNLFGGLNVLELDPQTFQLRRRVFAARAHWADGLKTWILEQGWVRDFDGPRLARYVPFPVDTLPELNEPPAYFKREVRQYTQLNWRELAQYISELHGAGFDVARLSVQWHKKFAYPLMTPIIMLVAVPFAFLVGTRGARGGIALAVAIAIAYWAASALFEAMGAVGQLPPILADWSPDAIFAFLGVYFFLKMPT